MRALGERRWAGEGGRGGGGSSGLIIVLARTERAGLPWSWGHQLSFKVMVDAPRPGEGGCGSGRREKSRTTRKIIESMRMRKRISKGALGAEEYENEKEG